MVKYNCPKAIFKKAKAQGDMGALVHLRNRGQNRWKSVSATEANKLEHITGKIIYWQEELTPKSC